jgi:apolipoprotein N-acyltransferase
MNDPLGLFDKDTAGEEEGVFEEAKAPLHMLLGFVLTQQSFCWVGVFIEDIGSQNETTMALLALGLVLIGAFQRCLPLIAQSDRV